MAATVIESNTPINIEQHFKIKAGPGAGKTYWLIQHIKHVLNTSVRLGKIKRIACEPVDCREMSLICKRSIKSPEHLYDSQGCLRNGF